MLSKQLAWWGRLERPYQVRALLIVMIRGVWSCESISKRTLKQSQKSFLKLKTKKYPFNGSLSLPLSFRCPECEHRYLTYMRDGMEDLPQFSPRHRRCRDLGPLAGAGELLLLPWTRCGATASLARPIRQHDAGSKLQGGSRSCCLRTRMELG